MITLPNKAPVAPPIVSNGASVPPEVPLANATAHETNFNRQRDNTTFTGKLPERTFVIFSYPTPNVCGLK